MTPELAIIEVVKTKAKQLDFTQADIANALGISIPTIKRWYKGKGLSVSNLEKLCDYLGLSLGEILLSIQHLGKANYTYTIEQERMLSQNPKALAIFDLLVSGYSKVKIQSKWNVSDKSIELAFQKLEKVSLLKIARNGNIVLKNHGEPQWIPNGPLSFKYRKQMIRELITDQSLNEAQFFIHDYLEEDVHLISDKINELRNLLLKANAKAQRSEKRKISYGSFFMFKEHEWNIRDLIAL